MEKERLSKQSLLEKIISKKQSFTLKSFLFYDFQNINHGNKVEGPSHSLFLTTFYINKLMGSLWLRL